MSSGPPKYSNTVPSGPGEQVSMESHYSHETSSQTLSMRPGYDEEATQMKGQTLKKPGSGAHGRSASHDKLRNPPNGSNVVLNRSMQENKVGRVYAYLVTASIVTRWILFILPVLGLLWIPGVLTLTSYPNAKVWGVGLLWWSIWLSILWGGWWAALAASRIVPAIIKYTVGVVAVSTRKYIDWMVALHRYTAFFAWSIAIWVSYLPIISSHRDQSSSSSSANALDIIGKLLLGSVFCSSILLFEKFSIQWIASNFHEQSYAERIADQKAAVKALVVLYRHSINLPDRLEAQEAGNSNLFLKLGEHVRQVTTTTATVFGNVASEIAGSSVLQPNSPQAIIKTALESPNKSRLLARRIFYSFARPGSEYILVGDIEKFFPTPVDAMAAFVLFDRDNNGDVSREELEAACLGFHREQLSIENSMQNLDNAVGRLDKIFMSVYVVVAALIFAAVLDSHVGTLLMGAGASFLGLSWLIGGTCQEILSSIIFLFVKHPFDIGDRVRIKDEYFTVKEMRLLSTIFLDKNGTLVLAPNNQLTTLFIYNIRRSPQMSETITFDVSYKTSFQDIEELRGKMLEFVKAERRDFEPVFDVTVKDISDQSVLTLSTEIKYRSNIQHGALSVRRRNKWICALRTCLAELKIYGPSGNPNAPPSVDRYTKVPWEIIERKDQEDSEKAMLKSEVEEERKKAGQEWKLGDKNAVLMDSADAVFGETAQMRMTNPRSPPSSSTGISTAVSQHPLPASEIFEMRPRSRGA